ncbi:hypothetical protein [Escherichia coli]|uniref:hypothetical protein n=1 Tax=Escherichia coli TaxID=562 RepID=UPI001CCACA09|nr:hypothetical protein [Escherichia coli]UBO62884.1 hypothetical protein LCE27_23210 [Escherichia coli]
MKKKVLCDGVEDRTVKLLCGMVQSSTTTDKTQPPQTDKKEKAPTDNSWGFSIVIGGAIAP